MKQTERQEGGETLQNHVTGKPGFRITEVLVNHRLGSYCTYIHVPLTVRPVIFFGVCKTVLSVVLFRVIKKCVWRGFCSISSNQRATTLCTHGTVCSMHRSTKEHGVSNDIALCNSWFSRSPSVEQTSFHVSTLIVCPWFEWGKEKKVR